MSLSWQPLRANVELKARIDDPDAAVAVARSLAAVDLGEEEQEDTYFSLGRYRLKLRESSSGKHCLIGYSRPNGPDARTSQYRISSVKDPSAMRMLMSKQWGVKVVVRKWRRLFLWEDRVRIHIDRVETLGHFLEFEAMLPDPVEDGESAGAASPEALTESDYDECAALLDIARLRHDFAIEDRDLIASSYSTLIQDSRRMPSGT